MKGISIRIITYIYEYSDAAVLFKCIFMPFLNLYNTFILTSDVEQLKITFTTLKANKNSLDLSRVSILQEHELFTKYIKGDIPHINEQSIFHI